MVYNVVVCLARVDEARGVYVRGLGRRVQGLDGAFPVIDDGAGPGHLRGGPTGLCTTTI